MSHLPAPVRPRGTAVAPRRTSRARGRRRPTPRGRPRSLAVLVVGVVGGDRAAGPGDPRGRAVGPVAVPGPRSTGCATPSTPPAAAASCCRCSTGSRRPERGHRGPPAPGQRRAARPADAPGRLARRAGRRRRRSRSPSPAGGSRSSPRWSSARSAPSATGRRASTPSIVTFVSVVLVLVVGLPLGVWMGTSRRVARVVTPVLDVMQTLPSFVYLLPVTLFFGIGGAPAVVATFVYAFPPVVRVTAEGIRGVDTSVLEASDVARDHRLPAAAAGPAADVAAHDPRRGQPVGDGGAVDGHDRRVHQLARPRRPGDQRAGLARRRDLVHRRASWSPWPR